MKKVNVGAEHPFMSDVLCPVHNAFDCLNLVESFDLCPQQLEQHYEQAQQRIHPDQWTSEIAKNLAIQKSIACTQAYLSLKSDEQRAQQLMQCHGYWPLPSFPDLFEILLDWQEQGFHPQAPDYAGACAAFSTAWGKKDILAAQRAYWWIKSLTKHSGS